MTIFLEDIAKQIGGEIIPGGSGVVGSLKIEGVASPESALPGQIAAIKNPAAFLKFKMECRASAFLVGEDLPLDRPAIKVKNLNLSFAKLLELFHPLKKPSPVIDPRAIIGQEVKTGEGVSIAAQVFLGNRVEVGKDVVIYPHVYIGDNVRIGDDCIIYPNVTIYENITIGNKVIIHSGAVLGSDGFGFAPDQTGKYYKIPQVGTVIIEDDVEIGANVCIDRATLDATIIKKGTKLDNLVQVAHNVSIGENSVLAAQVGIAGSSRVGNRVSLGGQVGVADHVNIEDNTMLAGQSGVIGDLKSGVYSGMPARDIRVWQKAQAALLKLPELIKEFRELKKKINPPRD